MLRQTLLSLALVASAGCVVVSPKASGGDHAISAPSPFVHATHAEERGGVACSGCHRLSDPSTGRVERPGSAAHAPCDRCHQARFFQPPGDFCRLCHVRIDPRGGPSPMQPWPPSGPVRRYPSVFNHQLHLDNAKMEARVGFHASCSDCHRRAPGPDTGEERAQLAGHAACATCHGISPQKPGAPALTMADCQRCHVSDAVVVPQGRRFITGDLTFSHARHERDLGGALISCRACHAAVADAADVEHIRLPAMIDCATCHEDPARTGPDKRIANCSVCHQQITSGVAPRNHLGLGAPESHTLAFRHDHGAAARDPQARCRFCHGGMSATTVDNCHECHTVMKPRDHSLRWATYDHGGEAAADRQRCALCHEADYCSRCHSQRPRSHTPFDSFINGGHAVEARLNMRTCLACHTFEDNCIRCHNGPAFPGRKSR